MTSRRLVLDAGPLIGFFLGKDRQHEESKRGFSQLRASKTQLLTPLPIIFEVYKWLLYRESVSVARHALLTTRRLVSVIDVTRDDLNGIDEVLAVLPNWNGSLEDALVMLTARRFDCAVWTFNYRDFAAFKDISLWNPH